MKHKKLVNECLMAAWHGDLLPLNDLIEYLLTQKRLTLSDIIRLGERHFGLPRQTIIETVKYFQ